MQSDNEKGPARQQGLDKRQRILDAALAVFLTRGYVGTSTDQVAAAAAVSKQTIYKYFVDKEGLFAALIAGVGENVHNPFEELVNSMHTAPDADSAIGLLAEQFTRSIMTRQVQEIRRLVIAEASRFPELGRLYWQRGFAPVLGSLADCLRVLDGRGLLTVRDPSIAAQHLAGMLLWIPSNRAMFCLDDAEPDGDELAYFIGCGVGAFVAAYRGETMGADPAQRAGGD